MSVAAKEDELPTATVTTPRIAGLDIVKASEGDDFQNELIYGLPGAGKTLLAASAEDVPEMRPVLYVDIEGGTETIRERYPNIDVIRVKPTYDKSGRIIRTAWDQLDDAKGLYESLKKGDGKYTTVIVDNVTELYMLAMTDVMTKTVAEHPERDFDVPAQREWGKASAQVRRWVRHMRDLDMNVIFTAHEKNIENEAGQVLKVVPSLPGKLATEVAGYVDMVLYLYTKTDKDAGLQRKLQTQPAGKYIAKDRSGKLPLILTQPTMKMIHELRKGNGNADSGS